MIDQTLVHRAVSAFGVILAVRNHANSGLAVVAIKRLQTQAVQVPALDPLLERVDPTYGAEHEREHKRSPIVVHRSAVVGAQMRAWNFERVTAAPAVAAIQFN